MEGAVQRLVADRVELHENEVPRSDLTSIFCSDPLAVNELPHGELASCCCDGSVSRNCWGVCGGGGVSCMLSARARWLTMPLLMQIDVCSYERAHFIDTRRHHETALSSAACRHRPVHRPTTALT